MPLLNNVRYASDSDHSRYESELTPWAISGLMHRSNRYAVPAIIIFLSAVPALGPFFSSKSEIGR